MREFAKRYDISVLYGVGEVPLILVGVVTAGTEPAGNYHPTGYNSQVLTRRYRIRVKIENVLQGKIAPGEIEIFYFVAAENRGSSGTHFSFAIGDREVFFLQKDFGEWRTITDNFLDWCTVRVFSGAHPTFKPYWPITQAITDLLLTRGVGAKDQEMIQAVKFVGGTPLFGQAEARARLQQVAAEETPPVRKEACAYLADWGQPCPEGHRSKVK